MKKLLLFLFCLLAVTASKVGAAEDRWDNESVQVSTVSFSSSTVLAFVGRGMIYGVGCSTSLNTNYFDIFDSSTNVNLDNGAVANGRRVYRVSNTNNFQTISLVPPASTTTVVSGDYWFPKPIRVKNGAAWLFSDQLANQGRLYFYTDDGNR